MQNLCYAVFFTDHLKHKTVNKITCEKSSVNPRLLCALYSFSISMISF